MDSLLNSPWPEAEYAITLLCRVFPLFANPLDGDSKTVAPFLLADSIVSSVTDRVIDAGYAIAVRPPDPRSFEVSNGKKIGQQFRSSFSSAFVFADMSVCAKTVSPAPPN